MDVPVYKLWFVSFQFDKLLFLSYEISPKSQIRSVNVITDNCSHWLIEIEIEIVNQLEL